MQPDLIAATSSFSFRYGGQDSATIIPKWQTNTQIKKLDSRRTQVVVRHIDPSTGLEVRCVSIAYGDFPATEWTVYLKNTGKRDTPIVEDFRALDWHIERAESDEFVLHHNVGSPADGTDYGPIETTLLPNSVKRISAAGGRATNTDLSYFNVTAGNQGTIVVVGWPGQWAADFVRDGGHGLKVRAGQELTHFRLHPGEEVRSPLIVLLNWKGDWIQGQNSWRRWMMAYGMPKPGGKLPKPIMLASSSRAYREMIGANEANQIMHIDRYLEEGFKLDYWWMDAGWYIQNQGWPQVGTWEPDPKRFPNGFKPISDYARARGVKTLVWFEPERVAPHTWLSDNHPEWLLNPLHGLIGRRSSALGTGEPCVVFNSNDKPVTTGGIRWEPKSLSFHPGPKGEYSVVRYAAPTGGKYKVAAIFSGIDQKTTTDIHVLQSGRPLFDSFIGLNGKGRRANFDQTVALEAGETLDFVVGYGNHDYTCDSTGIGAVITGPDGKPHDAAEEFGKWTYGYLSPSTRPDAATFKPYDVTELGGSSKDQLLDLGNPSARHWLVEHIDKLIVDNGIGLYRQDFNIDPLEFWRSNDAEDRQGITENKHIVGYLAYWDELRRRHPDMLIDSCASGGRRNDLETMRRAVPLWRSDYAYEPIGHQCMTYGISMWLPYHGTGTVAVESAPYYGGGVTPVHPYAFWSNAVPALGCGIDIREKGLDYAELRRLFGAWRSIADYYYGDYYPLTPYSRKDSDWIAWQFNLPEHGDGIIEAFRRPGAADQTLRVRLSGLERDATYRFTSIEAAELQKTEWTGRELMESGLTIRLNQSPAAAIIRFAKSNPI